MAKTWKDIDFDRMVSDERLLLAAKNAGKGKTKSISVQKYKDNISRLHIIRDELLAGTYHPLMTPDKEVWDSRSHKMRIIRRPAYRDQIVHHLIMLELQSHIMKYLIKHTIACIPNRGMEYGRKIIRGWQRNKRESRYIVQCDISHYYENVQSDILLAFLRKKIRDKRMLTLLELIIATFTNGLVLGYYVCQWFGALYLAIFDHQIKEKFGVKHYIRYVDNMVIACKTKKQASKVVEFIHSELCAIGLAVKREGKECIRVFKWAHTFIDFIGYRTYRDGRQTIRRSTYLRIRKQLNRIRKKHTCAQRQMKSMLSRRGIVLHSDCHTLFTEIEDIIASKRMRRRISYEHAKI